MTGALSSQAAAEHEHCVAFVCPFCKGRCEAHIHGDVETGDCFVIHTQPICQKFNELEPDDFMHEVNIQYGGHN